MLLRNLNSSHILTLINLTGLAMSKQLQTSGFEWMIDNKLDDWKHLSCILEVDLNYPKHLHTLHNDYSLAP